MKELGILGIIILVVIGAAVMGSRYYSASNQTAAVKSGAAANLIREDSQTMGPADAKVTIVEFMDPECESCATFNPVVKALVKENQPNIRLVVRYMPLHPNSMAASTFLEVAAEQGKFWQAQELLFRNQPEWGTKHGPPTGEPAPDVPALLEKYAMQLGLDPETLAKAIRDNKYAAKLERDKRDGQAVGARKTPTLFVNGKMLPGLDEAELRSMVQREMAK